MTYRVRRMHGTEMQDVRQHDGGPACAPCRAELAARGVTWWRGCEMHGIADCPICHRHPGQCSFGDCTAGAITRVTSTTTRETRRMCEACAELAGVTGWHRVTQPIEIAAGLAGSAIR